MSRNIDIFSEPYAIVFAGGGARGAWQIGVWKALREKFGNHAEAVSGTSVGALNAALYAMSPDDPTPAENIWTESIQKYPIITQWPELVNKVVTGVLATGSFIADLFSQQNKIRRSNEHLRSVIQEGIKGRTFHLPTYICAYDRNEKVSRFPQIDTDAMDEERRCEWLLASTAIPYIFPSIKIDGVEYSDGGFGWDHALRVKKSDLDNLKNVPLKPIEDLENIKNVFVLTLSQNEETFWQKANPDFNIIPIMPNKELGFALDFSKDHITEIMNQGFEDGQKWLKNKGRLIINAANLNQVHKIGEEIEACKKIFEGIKSLREELLADYNSEFKNALERYNNHKTEENKKELN
ncbi:MAG: patatin-like phospholipase family protein, partial [Lachnospiraceae bacterium]|nr:patatin-like phospholipase family protein [Lachnospiraceae bacterium]